MARLESGSDAIAFLINIFITDIFQNINLFFSDISPTDEDVFKKLR
ncbi:hypothetical protein LEP1GSC050_0691 [Leptospira broomii serovar Hurstbridge str. 5399]|uniref:Uncharacterized protein n=1 Tax=Leptospira broomii serovar Hurstbridge str. 5399 TaxID=1049789 RepID=T0FGW4_9LEPT|nr:hypothetical protein LEP1GSC050_0691 [Leptospira broomii serovar Hurstbridge str. 5399]